MDGNDTNFLLQDKLFFGELCDCVLVWKSFAMYCHAVKVNVFTIQMKK